MLNPSSILPGVLLLGVVLMLTDAAGQPATLYKPEQIATARANVARHDWAKALRDRLVSSVRFASSLTREELLAYFPTLTPWPTYGQSCPVCVGQQSSMGETGLWQWSPTEPEKLTCKYCKTNFPHPDYPETGAMEATRMGQRFTYYLTEAERAHPDDLTGKHAFRWASWPVHTSWTGMIRWRQASWAASQILPLAKLYALDQDPAYAERAAWLLVALAEHYPAWLYHSYNGVYADLPPGEAATEMGRHPRAGKFPPGTIVSAFPALTGADKDGFERLNNGFWGAGRLHSGISEEGGMLLDAAVAYDLIRDAVTADGRPVLSETEHETIRQDLLVAGADDLEHYAPIDNKCGPARALSAAVGALVGDPARIRRALDGFQRLLNEDFHTDGFCQESPSYSSMHLGLMAEIPEVLAGYSDPPGYLPETGERFDDFDPFVAVPRYRLALESMVRMLRPDRKYPVIGDTHAGSGISSLWVEILCARYGDEYAGLLTAALGKPLGEAGSEYALWHRRPDLAAPEGPAKLPLRSEWFPGWRVGVLRLGGFESSTAFYLNGNERHGHRHDDTLGILYHAFGEELASDRGYIWDDPRNAWTRSTLAHNLVTVDGANQQSKDRTSTLILAGMGPEIEVLEASANAYTQCEEYRRLNALVKLDDAGGTYALDIFRVRGGKLHQYGMQSNGNLTEVVDRERTPLAREHKWLSHFRETSAEPGWRARWQSGDLRYEVIGLSAADRLVVADAPGWRTYKGHDLHAPPIQQIFAEREGEDLVSRFVALLVPYRETSPVRVAELLRDDEQVIAVRVELDQRTDYLIAAVEDGTYEAGPVTLNGRFGFVSVTADGEVRQAYLLDGTSLALNGQPVVEQPAARATVAVARVADRIMTLADDVPAEIAPGDYVLLNGTGYEIESITGRQVTVRDYPLTGATEAVFLPAVGRPERTGP